MDRDIQLYKYFYNIKAQQNKYTENHTQIHYSKPILKNQHKKN